MIKDIIMPKLGETMEEGTIAKWLKKEGDSIERGEPIVEVTTDKASFEVEAPAGGVLRKIVCPASETPVKVIEVIGYIAGSMDEKLPEKKADAAVPDAGRQAPAAEKPAAAAPSEPAPSPAAAAAAPAAAVSGRIIASPRAKKVAALKGVDLSTVKGSGPRGRIVEKDVLKAAGQAGTGVPAPVMTGASSAQTPICAAEAPGQLEDRVTPLAGMRKVIADRLSQSKREKPHFYIKMDIDMTEASAKKVKGVSFNDIVIRGIAKTIEQFPMLNSTFENNRICQHSKVNAGVAVSLKNGLVVPVVPEANHKSIGEIAAVTATFKQKMKENSFKPADMKGGTLTISNMGMFGIEEFSAIINPPEVAIFAVGAITPKPVVINGGLFIRKMMTVTMSVDHRVIDGAYAAAFMRGLKETFEVNHGKL